MENGKRGEKERKEWKGRKEGKKEGGRKMDDDWKMEKGVGIKRAIGLELLPRGLGETIKQGRTTIRVITS